MEILDKLQKQRQFAVSRTLIIACGALAREISVIRSANNLSHIDVKFLPAILHNTPSCIPERVRSLIHEGREQGYERIFIGYADCGTGGKIDALCAEEKVERILGPHCYSFFYGNEEFSKSLPEDERVFSFFLTDFLTKNFDTLVWKGLGLNKHPELLEMYFGNYKYLTYLSQTHDVKLFKAAELSAEKLGLQYKNYHTGYGDLEKFFQALPQTLPTTMETNRQSDIS
jgi:hypothetical protein